MDLIAPSVYVRTLSTINCESDTDSIPPPNDITNWISILPFRKVKFNDGSFIFTRNDLRDFFLNDNKVVAVKVLIPSKLASLLPHFDFRISKPLVEFS